MRIAAPRKRLRAVRMARQETQQGVVVAVSNLRAYLSSIESGGENITLNKLWSLADHFGLSARQLMPHNELREHIDELVTVRDASASRPDKGSAGVAPATKAHPPSSA